MVLTKLVLRGMLKMNILIEVNTAHRYALMTCLFNALHNNHYIIKLDIPGAYLCAELGKEIYLKCLSHYQLNDELFRLNKSLNGAKQSDSNWYVLVNKFLINNCNLTLTPDWAYIRVKEVDQDIIVVYFFVNDIVITTLNKNS